MTSIDRELLAELMASFEMGGDLAPDNPFDTDNAVEVLPVTEPFLEGCAVPDTAQFLPPGASQYGLAFATAGLLQGLVLGFEYARRSQS